METFSYHCPSCGSGLKLNVFSQRLMCESCGKDYNPATLAKDASVATPDGTTTSEQQKIVKNFVEMNLYHCGNCGAEVVTNDVEVTKFCSFCGQSAIIYDRVTEIDKPDLIIPFRISKEAAINAIKEKNSTAKFIPPEFETLSVDSAYAIYLPYYVYDAELKASGHVNVPNQKQSSNMIVHNIAGRTRKKVFFDASRKLNDSVSIYLNPYPYSQAVPFEPTYLSGFYADIADVDSEVLSKKVGPYLWEILGDELLDQVPGGGTYIRRNQNNASVTALSSRYYREPLYTPIKDNEELEIISVESVLCPVYFITLHTSEGLANLLVNGYTGKVVGSIPASEKLIRRSLIQNSAILAGIMGIVFAFIFFNAPIIWAAMLAVIVFIIASSAAKDAKKRYTYVKDEMNTSSMFNLRKK